MNELVHGLKVETEKLNSSQLCGDRCLICNAKWDIPRMFGGYTHISKVPTHIVGPMGETTYICAPHIKS